MKNVMIGLALVAVMILALWQTCFKVTNEIGPVGADKAGRQIFLQSLDAYLDEMVDSLDAGYTIDVESDFFDRPLAVRAVQEPMRTTFRLNYRVQDESAQVDTAFAREFLNAPSNTLIDLYREDVSLRENWTVPVDEFRSSLDDLAVGTVAELLAALGFRRFEVLVDEQKLNSIELPEIGKGNVQWAGK